MGDGLMDRLTVALVAVVFRLIKQGMWPFWPAVEFHLLDLYVDSGCRCDLGTALHIRRNLKCVMT